MTVRNHAVAMLLVTALLLTGGRARAESRSSFRIVECKAGEGSNVVLELAYANPGASSRKQAANEVHLFFHRDGAPQNRDATYVDSTAGQCKRGAREVAQGIPGGTVCMPKDSGTCKVTVDLRASGFEGVKADDEVWLAGVFPFGASSLTGCHRWGCWSGMGNRPVSFRVPAAAAAALGGQASKNSALGDPLRARSLRRWTARATGLAAPWRRAW